MTAHLALRDTGLLLDHQRPSASLIGELIELLDGAR